MTARLHPDLIPPAPDLLFERALWQAGLKKIAGIDEAGRGALAGPVTAGVVLLGPNSDPVQSLQGVRDSKLMTNEQREYWAGMLRLVAAEWSLGFASAREIDALGVIPATRLAAYRALSRLINPPDHLLLDYILLPDCPIPQTALIKGDARSLSIAAASILAKVARDHHMRAIADQYPGYGFARHKGYGTDAHRNALRRLGATPEHRLSFAPLRTSAGDAIHHERSHPDGAHPSTLEP